MSVEVIIAAIGSMLLAAWAAWRAHARAVITAEQRGRVEEIERQRAVAEGVRLTREAGVRAVLADGASSARAAEVVVEDPVEAAEVAAWAAPPKGPAS